MPRCFNFSPHLLASGILFLSAGCGFRKLDWQLKIKVKHVTQPVNKLCSSYSVLPELTRSVKEVLGRD